MVTIASAGQQFRDGTLTPIALVESLLACIAAEDPGLDSIIATLAPRARAAAQGATAELAAGHDRGPLHGIPYLITDVIDVANTPTTCNSRLRANHIATEDAAIITRLTAAGAIPLGKTTIFEFATGAPAPDSLYRQARNPHDRTRAAGATGAGAAVAAGFAPFALALDTGGAARASAALCGCLGLKPTHGLIDLGGIMPLSPTLDHAGLIATTAEDLTTILATLTTASPANCTLRIALLTDWLERTAPTITAALHTTAATLAAHGATITPTPLGAADLFPAANIIYLAEAFALHQPDLAAHPTLYTRPTRERLIAGAHISAAELRHAHTLRHRLIARVDQLLTDHDILVCPAAPTVAQPIGQPTQGSSGALTMPFNLTGHPALGLAAGRDPAGLPLPIQLVARRNDEATLLHAAALCARTATRVAA